MTEEEDRNDKKCPEITCNFPLVVTETALSHLQEDSIGRYVFDRYRVVCVARNVRQFSARILICVCVPHSGKVCACFFRCYAGYRLLFSAVWFLSLFLLHSVLPYFRITDASIEARYWLNLRLKITATRTHVCVVTIHRIKSEIFYFERKKNTT